MAHPLNGQCKTESNTRMVRARRTRQTSPGDWLLPGPIRSRLEKPPGAPAAWCSIPRGGWRRSSTNPTLRSRPTVSILPVAGGAVPGAPGTPRYLHGQPPRLRARDVGRRTAPLCLEWRPLRSMQRPAGYHLSNAAGLRQDAALLRARPDREQDVCHPPGRNATVTLRVDRTTGMLAATDQAIRVGSPRLHRFRSR